MSQSLIVLSNSGGNVAVTGGGGANTGAGVTRAAYRYPFTFTKASTHTAQTLVPLGSINRSGGIIKSVTASWLEVNAANTTLCTVDVLKRAAGAANTGTSIFSTVGTLTNNATTQTVSSISTNSGSVPAFNTGSANINPILSTTASKLLCTCGDQLVLTTVATSTQGTDLSVTVEVEYNLADDTASSGLI